MAIGAELTLVVRAVVKIAAYGLGALPVGLGQHRIVKWVYDRWFSLATSPLELKMTFRTGTRLQLDVSDFTQAQAYLTRRYDPELVKFISKQLMPGDVYVDVGAHVGMVALSVARQVPGITVHAFEPHFANAKRFRQNQALSKLSNIIINEIAIGDQEGELALARTGKGSDSYYITNSGDGLRVPVTTLADYANKCRLSTIKVLKLDIEGYEPAALRGAEELIREGRIKVVVCELSQHLLARSGGSESSLVDWLARYGYAMHELPRLGLHRWRRIPDNHYRNAAFVYSKPS